MLRAVEEMISNKSVEHIDIINAKINCARVILSEIIKDLEASETIYDSNKKLKPSKDLPIIPEENEQLPENSYQIIVDANKRITEIKNMPLDGKLVLDGKIITHKEAIGKTFTRGRFI
jgi:hypothetical protein